MSSHYRQILENLSKEFAIEKFFGQTVFKVNRAGFLYFRYSKRYSGDKYFFGAETSVISQLQNAIYTVLFVCGDENNVLVIPSDLFNEIIKDVAPSGSQWKVNIFFTGEKVELKVSGKERIDVTNYLNNTDFILSKGYFVEQKIPRKEIDYELIKKKLESKKDDREVKIELLKSRLVNYASLSEEPTKFEEVITEVFGELGFECEHIGGSGKTDVLAKSNYRSVIEAKATKRASVTKVNFTRLKQHKKRHGADFVIVVAKNFDPAVVRDSEIENAILFPISILTDLLEISKNYPLNPNLLLNLFIKQGVIKTDDLEYVRDEYKRWQAYKKGLYILIDNLSEEKRRTCDELVGAVNAKLEIEAGVSDFFSREEMRKILGFLQIEPLKIVHEKEEGYTRVLDIQNSCKLLNMFVDYLRKGVG
ncbi:MAG: restriction endonuclease [Methanophagales archaeon]|nr:restriction endonuclease [Methanophagales archaeon]